MNDFIIFDALTIEPKTFHVADGKKTITSKHDLVIIRDAIAPEFVISISSTLTMEADILTFYFLYKNQIKKWFIRNCEVNLKGFVTTITKKGNFAVFRIIIE